MSDALARVPAPDADPRSPNDLPGRAQVAGVAGSSVLGLLAVWAGRGPSVVPRQLAYREA